MLERTPGLQVNTQRVEELKKSMQGGNSGSFHGIRAEGLKRSSPNNSYQREYYYEGGSPLMYEREIRKPFILEEIGVGERESGGFRNSNIYKY